MEMTVDFGPPGFGEDIDIDLDFPAGEPDEDMELEDFDRLHGVHVFHSDTRDELMAEGDDSSYNMIDAIEIDANASAAAANDIDIELEPVVESIWQQDPPPTTDLNLETEIDYLDEMPADTMDADKNDADTGEWMSSAMDPDANEINHANERPEEIFTGGQEPYEELLLEDSAAFHGELSESIKLSHSGVEAAHSQAVSSPKDEQSTLIIDPPENDVVETAAQASDHRPTLERDEHGPSRAAADTGIQSQSPNFHLQNVDEQHVANDLGETAEAGSDYIDETVVPHDSREQDHTEVTEPRSVEEDHVDPPQPDESYEFADNASEYQLRGDNKAAGHQTVADDASEYQLRSDNETTDGRTIPDDAPPAESSAEGFFDAQPTESDFYHDLKGSQHEVVSATGTDTPAVEIGDRDDPIELADHYGVYISYGETNYWLFARSADDDPNQYFLADMSALNLPLTQFLASLREVISEEISPLDDLVLQVDGLGLEFSESTTPDFLGKFTFGDFVVLHDKLVKNEQTESSPPVHTYLTVRPNCTRRMMALGESANAGRGLTEVALYHDSVDEEQDNDAGSLDTDLSNADYNDGESGSVYAQEDHEERDDSITDGGQRDSPSAPIEVLSEHAADSDNEADDLGHDIESVSAGGSSNVIDHDDASISKQDHVANESSVSQLQESYEHERRASMETSGVDELKLRTPKITPANPSADTSTSENTSVTATLDGEDGNEIDYNSDEDNDSSPKNVGESNMRKLSFATSSNPNVPDNDEITWESDEEEESKTEMKDGLRKDTVQVSPLSGKRARSDSDTLDGADEKNDNKRRRS